MCCDIKTLDACGVGRFGGCRGRRGRGDISGRSVLSAQRSVVTICCRNPKQTTKLLLKPRFVHPLPTGDYLLLILTTMDSIQNLQILLPVMLPSNTQRYGYPDSVQVAHPLAMPMIPYVVRPNSTRMSSPYFSPSSVSDPAP